MKPRSGVLTGSSVWSFDVDGDRLVMHKHDTVAEAALTGRPHFEIFASSARYFVCEATGPDDIQVFGYESAKDATRHVFDGR